MKKKYIVDGQVYEIPDEQAADFLKDFPHAKVSYTVNGTDYEIPHEQADAFETDMGLKKKVSSNVGQNVSGGGVSNGQTNKTGGQFTAFNSQNGIIQPQGTEGAFTMGKESQTAQEPIQQTKQSKESDGQLPDMAALIQPKQARIDATKNVFGTQEVKTPEQVKQQRKIHDANVEIGIRNTAKKALSQNGQPVDENSLQFRQKVQQLKDKVKNGDATFAISPEGELGLERNYGISEGVSKGWNNAMKSAEDATNFNDMDAADKVAYLKEHPQEQNKYPEYLRERGNEFGSVAEKTTEQVPFLAKAAVGTAAGVAATMLAPETMGASLEALPAVGGFLMTADDAYQQGKSSKIQAEYNRLRRLDPNGDEVAQMQEAEKQGEIGGAGGLVTDALLMKGGAGGLSTDVLKTGFSNESKQVLSDALKTGLHMANVSAGVKGAENIVGAMTGSKITPSEALDESANEYANKFKTGFALHALMAGGKLVSKQLASAIKYGLIKDKDPNDIQASLKFNEDNGIVPPGTTEKVMQDLSSYKEALDKTPSGLSPEAEASYAGLVEKKNKLVEEQSTKDETAKEVYTPQIEQINNQLKEIINTNKPVEYDEITGQKLELPNEEPIKQTGETSAEPIQAKEISSTETKPTEIVQPAKEEVKRIKSEQVQEPNVENKPIEVTDEMVSNAQKEHELAKKNLAKAQDKIAKTQSTQQGMFGGEQKGMFAVGADEAKKALDPLKQKVKETKAAFEDLQRKKEVQDANANPDIFAGREYTHGDIKRMDAIKVYNVLKELDEPSDARAFALDYFAKKGKLSEKSLNDDVVGSVKRAKLNTGEKEKKTNEARAKDFVSKDGKSISEIAHSIWDSIPEHLQEKISTEDLENELIDVANSFDKRVDVAKGYIDKYHMDKAAENFYQNYYDVHEAEHENEVKQMMEWSKEQWDKEKEITESDEYINHLINQYENEQSNINKNNEPSTGTETKVNKEFSGTESGKEQANKGTDNGTTGIGQNGSSEPANEPTGQPSNEPVSDGEGNLTSIKNEVTNAKRNLYGFKEAETAIRKSFGDSWDEAKKKLDEGYSVQDLITELKKKPRAVSDVENALLLYQQNLKEIELEKTNEFINKASESDNPQDLAEGNIRRARILDELQDIYDVDKKIGTEAGRGLSARRMMIDRKYSLVNMLSEKRAANNGRPLTDAEISKIEELHKQIKDAQKAFDEYKKKAESEILDLQNKVLGKEIKDKKSAAQKIRDFADKIERETKGKTYSSIVPITPKMVVGALRLIADGIEKGGKLIDLINDAVDNIKKENPNVDEGELKSRINKAAIESGITGKQEKPIKDYSFIINDKEAIRLKAEEERAKLKFDREVKKDDENKKESKLTNLYNTFVKWQRGFKLSNPITLGKLGMAGITRLAMTPIEDIVGAGYSALLPKIANGAIGEGGGLRVRETARAYKNGILLGMKDSAQIMKRGMEGKSDLDVVFGKGAKLPPEMIDFFGHLHSAEKAPFKRAIFERQLEKRLRRSIGAGVDVSDPMVQTQIAVDAYKDANRAIFMQDNKVADAWQKSISYLEKNDNKGLAAVLKVLIPFVKVPTNIAAEIGTHVYGVPVGAIKTLHTVFTKGMENMTNEEKDVIMRNFKKGSLGIAALYLGYSNPQIFGGYYQDKERRNPNDTKANSVKIFGQNIPAWLFESPIFQAMQIGATVRRVADSRVKGVPKGLGEGVIAGSLGMLDHVPMINQPTRIFKSISDPKERQYYLDELAKGTVEPALMQKIAEWTDKSNQKRNPSTLKEHLEMGIPALRSEVPFKKSALIKKTDTESEPKTQLLPYQIEANKRAKARWDEPVYE